MNNANFFNPTFLGRIGIGIYFIIHYFESYFSIVSDRTFIASVIPNEQTLLDIIGISQSGIIPLSINYFFIINQYWFIIGIDYY